MDHKFDEGNRCISMHLVQVLGGTANAAAPTCSAIPPELGSIYQLLKNAKSKFATVTVSGTAQEQARVWREIWETIESLRVLCEVPSAWSTHFVNSLAGVLEPRERLALRGPSGRNPEDRLGWWRRYSHD